MTESTLFLRNTPGNFWKVIEPIDDEVWEQAIHLTLAELDIPCSCQLELLAWSLGEGSYGNQKWRLSFPKQVYYQLKPWIPQSVSRSLRQLQQGAKKQSGQEDPFWPIDDRFVRYLWQVLYHLMQLIGKSELDLIGFWPQHKGAAFVLTHDIETEEGQKYVEKIVEMESKLGFKSAFFFVMNKYPLDYGLIATLCERGFEVGIHGYNHDGKLFCFSKCPRERIEKINAFAKRIKAHSFRAPLTLRHPERMQLLDVDYDLSFFDTDPYEPMPGGTMSIFPYHMGKLVELPYTLAQDYTLFELLNLTSPEIWKKKVDFLRQSHGMILLDTHPDYLMLRENLKHYQEFLNIMATFENQLFHALPVEVGSWWKKRTLHVNGSVLEGATITRAKVDNGTKALSLAV